MSLTRIVLLLLFLSVSGCAQIGYYGQAAMGQWEIIAKREKIDHLIASGETPESLRRKLELVSEIRQFAVDELGLPDNNTFRYYSDLQRPYVVWNVVAAPRFSISPKTWCFPIAGCVAYKGYFSEDKAVALNTDLTDQGYDTFQYGVSAYSTLGWFSDPVLSTFIDYREASLAGLIFHELAHQVVYVKDDSAFNEAFATAVELAGLETWLRMRKSEETYLQYLEVRKRNSDITDIVLEFRNQLSTLYQSGSQSELAEGKKSLFDEMKTQYSEITLAGNGTPYYDWWFELDLNNAHLVSLSTYNQLVPAFSRVLDEAGSLPGFYELIRAKAKLSREERNTWLTQYQDG